MTQQNDYTAAGRDLLAKAHEELAQGDVRQASEKGWGAAAQMVNAIAVVRGWEHNGHALLFQTVRRLAEETGDEQIALLFQVANSLHSNFSENWLPEGTVRSSLANVDELVDKLEQLLD